MLQGRAVQWPVTTHVLGGPNEAALSAHSSMVQPRGIPLTPGWPGPWWAHLPCRTWAHRWSGARRCTCVGGRTERNVRLAWRLQAPQHHRACVAERYCHPSRSPPISHSQNSHKHLPNCTTPTNIFPRTHPPHTQTGSHLPCRCAVSAAWNLSSAPAPFLAPARDSSLASSMAAWKPAMSTCRPDSSAISCSEWVGVGRGRRDG